MMAKNESLTNREFRRLFNIIGADGMRMVLDSLGQCVPAAVIFGRLQPFIERYMKGGKVRSDG